MAIQLQCSPSEANICIDEIVERICLGSYQDRDVIQTAIDRLDDQPSLDNPIGAFNLGLILWLGLGGRRDPDQGLKHLRRAAAAGYSPAQALLGYLYHKELADTVSPGVAIHYYRSALSTCEPLAWAGLGEAYYEGFGVEADLPKAFHYLHQAAKAGVDLQQGFRSFLAREGVTPTDTANSERNYRKLAREQRSLAELTLTPQKILSTQFPLPLAIPAQYDEAIDFNEGLATVSMATARGQWLYGVINRQGDMVIGPSENRYLNFREGLAAFQDAGSGRWGYVNHQGETVIAPQFRFAHEFHDGFALVESQQRKRGFISSQGRLLIRPECDGVAAFGQGLFAALRGDDVQIISATGTLAYQLNIPHCKMVCGCSGDDVLSYRLDNGKWGFVTPHGKIIPGVYDRADRLHNGLVAVIKDAQFVDSEAVGSKWGFADRQGNMVTDCCYESWAGDASPEGLLPVKRGGKWGYIDCLGKTVIDFQFDQAYEIKDGYGLIRIKKRWGFVTPRGEVALFPPCEEAENLGGGYFVVTMSGKRGIVNTSGDVVILPSLDKVWHEFDGGLLLVERRGKYGFLDYDWRFVVEPVIPSVPGHFYDGLAWVKVGHHFGYIRLEE